MTDETVPVTQADRDAAVEHYSAVMQRIKSPQAAEVQDSTIKELKSGRWDKDFSVQLFARHRLTATQSLTAELAERDAEIERLRAALQLWRESGCMTDYDEDGNPSPIPLDRIGDMFGGDVQMAAKATLATLTGKEG